jgi:hypothetical protein
VAARWRGSCSGPHGERIGRASARCRGEIGEYVVNRRDVIDHSRGERIPRGEQSPLPVAVAHGAFRHATPERDGGHESPVYASSTRRWIAARASVSSGANG